MTTEKDKASNDKTAEEILSKYETYVRHADVPIFLAENAIKAMHDYSAQKLKEYKEVIRELLPLAEIGLTWYPRKAVVIDRAKKLLDK